MMIRVVFEYQDMTLDAIEREFDLGLKHLVDVGWKLLFGDVRE